MIEHLDALIERWKERHAKLRAEFRDAAEEYVACVGNGPIPVEVSERWKYIGTEMNTLAGCIGEIKYLKRQLAKGILMR